MATTVVYPEAEVISRVLNSEVLSFTWKIEDFALIKGCPDIVRAQKFEFVAGRAIRNKATFMVFLDTCNDKDGNSWISLYLTHERDPDRELLEAKSYVAFQVEIRDKNGKVFHAFGDEVGHTLEPHYNSLKRVGFEKLIHLEEPVSTLPLINGGLVMHIRVKLFVPSEPTVSDVTLEYIVEKYQSEFKQTATSYLSKVPILMKTDITLVSKEGQNFPANKDVLSARSSIFEAFFASSASESEKQTVRLPDVTSKVVEILLEFMGTGVLSETWRDDDVLENLTYAAEKYGLRDILQFFDDVFGYICNLENVGLLLTIADKYKLKKAETVVLLFIKENGLGSTEELFNIANSIQLAKLNISSNTSVAFQRH